MVPDSRESEQENVTKIADAQAAEGSSAARPGLGQRIWAEVKSRPFGYTVLALFVVAGPVAAPFLFPQAPPAAAIVGGLAFGIYAALSAVPQKFL